MNKIFIFSLVVLCMNCSAPVSEEIILKGDVKNTNGQELKLSRFDFDQVLELDGSGFFRDTLNLPTEGYYTLSMGREAVSVYLVKGTDLGFTADGVSIGSTIKFLGKGAVENNALQRQNMVYAESLGDMKLYFSMREDEFIAKTMEAKEAVYSFLDDEDGLSDSFVNDQKENADYSYNSTLMNYGAYHGGVIQQPDFVVSDEFLAQIPEVDMNNEEAYKKSQSYRDLVMSSVYMRMGEIFNTEKNPNTSTKMAIAEVENGFIKSEIIHDYAGLLITPDENLKESYDFIMEQNESDVYQSEYVALYDKLKLLAKGQPSPVFTEYENHAGGTISLSDLVGRFVYIDVWATWCGPCKAEIPSLKVVEEAYRDRNIEFVSLSVDELKDHDKWKDFVTVNELGGIQLFADKAWQSEFVQAFQIEGIPRFILIDPKGNIVTADAPRPSDPALSEMLDKLGV